MKLDDINADLRVTTFDFFYRFSRLSLPSKRISS